MRAYEILPATRVLRQTFGFSDSSLYLFNAVAAPARNGRSAAITYNTGNASSPVQLRARARQAGSPINTFEAPIVLGTSPTPPSLPGGCDTAPTPPVDPCRWGD